MSGELFKVCESCRATFSARGAWQKTCPTCFREQKNRELATLKAERDAALDLVRQLRLELRIAHSQQWAIPPNSGDAYYHIDRLD